MPIGMYYCKLNLTKTKVMLINVFILLHSCPECRRPVHVTCGTPHSEDDEGFGQRVWCSSVRPECMLSTVPAVETAVHVDTDAISMSSSVPALTTPEGPALKKKKKRSVYPQQCKEIGVHLARKNGVSKTCKEIDVYRTTLQRWKTDSHLPHVPLDQAPPETAIPRDLAVLKTVEMHLRTDLENINMYQHYVQLPPKKKAKLKKSTTQAIRMKQDEFITLDGCGEEYLTLLESIDESLLEDRLASRMENILDGTIRGAEQAMINDSLNHSMRLRETNKAKATDAAWKGRKRNFLVRCILILKGKLLQKGRLTKMISYSPDVLV